MTQIAYQASKMLRFFLVLVLAYIFVTHVPFFPPPPQVWTIKEIFALIAGILMAIAGFLGYWVEEVAETGFGSYRSGLLFGVFGFIVVAYFLMRFVP